jgi:methionine synthase II (cobalamin-independent)
MKVEDFTAYCATLERMARDVAPLAPRRWLVLDEPVLQSIGTPFFPGNPELAIEALNAVIDSTAIPARWGLHICGNTDFSIISRVGIDLFHFDAYAAWEALQLYSEDLEGFVGSGGTVALGAIPVSREEGERERARGIVQDAVRALGDLGQREVPIGPACGMRAVTIERAIEVGEMVRELIAGPSG